MPLPILGFISDTHVSQAVPAVVERSRLAIAWMLETAGGDLIGIMHAGDATDAPYVPEEKRFSAWARSPSGGNVPPQIPIIACVGNHDADAPMNAPYGTISDPFSYWKSVHGGSENYTWESGNIRVVVVNNISDHLTDDGIPCYHNCNPPGNRECNPDWSGMSLTISDQRRWLYNACNSSHDWKIILCHRPPIAPINYYLRPQHHLFRDALRVPIDRGVSLVASGDVHVGWFGGPYYPPDVYVGECAIGAYVIGAAGGYAARPVDLTAVHGGMHWASGEDGTHNKPVHAALIAFGERSATVTIWEADNANPSGRVVYVGNMQRNFGAQ